MAPTDHGSGGTERFILRHEKAGFLDILSLLILRRPITSYSFVDVGDQSALQLGNVRADWVVALTVLIQKVLTTIYLPMKWLGIAVEFVLNLFALNGGVLGLIWNIFRCKLVIPRREAPNFRSMIGMIDGRTELKETSGGAALNGFPILGCLTEKQPLIRYFNGGEGSPEAQVGLGAVSFLELTMMAAKVAYENAAYVENVVKNVWKMHFVGFYSCWNKYLEADTTQAFIFMNKATEANLIVVAFRGTEPFNAQDWSTDVNLSWLQMGKLGKLHAGFLKALGLQDDTDVAKAFPKDTPNLPKPVAYYTLRETLRRLLNDNPNAKIIVTGHSLGGALAAIFPGLLSMHDEANILKALFAVFTYGQPRVGDVAYTTYFRAFVQCEFLRMVYRYDIVPRIPFDFPPFAVFKHGGKCVYYDGWYKGKIMEDDAPNKNYFDPKYAPSMYLNAWGDLFKGMFMGLTQGKDYREGLVSILYRASGLILPGIASHSPRDYVNAGRLAKIASKEV